MLYFMLLPAAAWVRIYTSSTARANDAPRVEGVDPHRCRCCCRSFNNRSQTIYLVPALDPTVHDSTIYVAVKTKVVVQHLLNQYTWLTETGGVDYVLG